jgi:hypothetical protein
MLETLESRAMLHAAGVLSGSVFFDMNGDGTRDTEEVGIPGVVIRLSASDPADASRDRSTITDDNGTYTFDELGPGTYQLSRRPTPATIGQDSTSVGGSAPSNNLLSNVVLEDDQNLSGNNFGGEGLHARFISYAWFTTFRPNGQQLLRETIATSEEVAGDPALAASIRAGGSEVPNVSNSAPIATDDGYSVGENEMLTIAAGAGVLANDIDSDGNTLTATLVGQASDGVASINDDGSFTSTPKADFSGTDAFTYQASDTIATSNLATVRINVNNTNQSPVASDDTYTVGENTVLTVDPTIGVLVNDTDPDGECR